MRILFQSSYNSFQRPRNFPTFVKTKNNYSYQNRTPQAAIPVYDTLSVSPTLTCTHWKVLILCRVPSLLRLSNRNIYAFLNAPNSVTASGSQLIWFYHYNNASVSNKLWKYSEQVRGMKRENQQDATIRCLLLTSVSTCFDHHYAHLQENKGSVTAFGVLFSFCWMWLVVVVGRCFVGCEHCSHSTTHQMQWQNLCSPEDGHNDDRNMLTQKLIINI